MKEKLVEVANHLMDLAQHYVETEEIKQMKLPKHWKSFIETVNRKFDWGFELDVTPELLSAELFKQLSYLTEEYEAVNSANQFLHDQIDELRVDLDRVRRQEDQIPQAPMEALAIGANEFTQGQMRVREQMLNQVEPPRWIEDRLPNARQAIPAGLDPFDFNPRLIQPQDNRGQTRNAFDDLMFRQEPQRTDFDAPDEEETQ